MKKFSVIFFLCLGIFTNLYAQNITGKDIESGGWVHATKPELVLSGATLKQVGVKLETQYKGTEVEIEKQLQQVFIGTTWKFSKFAGMDSPQNKIQVSNAKGSQTNNYNIGLTSLYVETSTGKIWQGNIFTKGNLVCFIHNGYISDNFMCIITWERQDTNTEKSKKK